MLSYVHWFVCVITMVSGRRLSYNSCCSETKCETKSNQKKFPLVTSLKIIVHYQNV